MKTQIRETQWKAAAGLVLMLIGTAVAKPARAVEILDDPVQIDDRITQLLQSSNSLCWEMYRYHQQEPNFDEVYRAAKEIWTRSDQVRGALQSGPMETEALNRQAAEIQQMFSQLETTLAKWGDGDRSSLAINTGVPVQRTIVTPGVGFDLPVIGVRVGRPQFVVTDEVNSALERRRLHPNSPGSKRSLERAVSAVKVAVNYLLEDAGVTAPANSPTPAASEAPKPQDSALPAPGATVVPTPKKL